MKYDEPVIRDDSTIRLTVAAALHLPEFAPVGRDFTQVIQVLVDEVKTAPVDPFEHKPVVISSGNLWHKCPTVGPALQKLLHEFLQHEPISLASGFAVDHRSAGWTITLNREALLKFHGIRNVADYVHRIVEWAREIPQGISVEHDTREVIDLPESTSSYFQDSLVMDLEAVPTDGQTSWNLNKLLSLVYEIDTNYNLKNFYATHALIRAFLDHVRPIFGKRNFAFVVEQYNWTATDKRYMKKLEEFRGQADDALHRQIRQREDIIHFDDLPPRAWINRLLDEVLALLEKNTR